MTFMQKTAAMIDYCNEETVHIPLEGLTFFSKVIKRTANYNMHIA